jgi:hypothetical protein
MTLAIAVLLRVKSPNWIRRRLRRTSAGNAARPAIEFYAETLDQLARVGITRIASQTPAELADHATEKLAHPLIPSIAKPMRVLTSTFYRLRFGNSENHKPDLEMSGPIEHARQRNPEVTDALAELTRSVDLLVVNSNRAERTN